jgi:ATPase family protein associated with various cellular activities (AAA)
MGGMSAANLPIAPPMTKTDSSARDGILELKVRIGKSVLEQDHLVESMLIGLLANGNLLIESLPGLAKTRAVKTLAKNLAAELSRVQFTPDLLPSDVTGAEIYVQTANGGQFQFAKGPIFANLVLAARPPRYSRRCWKLWRSARSPSPAKLTKCPTCSWCSQPRIRSSRKVPTHCQRRSSTVS